MPKNKNCKTTNRANLIDLELRGRKTPVNPDTAYRMGTKDFRLNSLCRCSVVLIQLFANEGKRPIGPVQIHDFSLVIQQSHGHSLDIDGSEIIPLLVFDARFHKHTVVRHSRDFQRNETKHIFGKWPRRIFQCRCLFQSLVYDCLRCIHLFLCQHSSRRRCVGCQFQSRYGV